MSRMRFIGNNAITSIVLFAIATLAGCHSVQPCCDTNAFRRDLASRTGQSLETTCPDQEVIPAGVTLDDGLNEDEAVQIALTNNSLFQAAVAQLGVAAGDAKQASLIANPQVLLYFPTAAKEGQYTLYQPIESYLLRPLRVKVANQEFRRVGDQLVQNGLTVARDVRLAYVDLAVATEQAALARESLTIRQGIAELTDRRFEKGDISELETITARVDQLNARAALGVQEQTVAIACAQLLSLMGVPFLTTELRPSAMVLPEIPVLDEHQLIDQALACRPDYQSANWAIAAASQRSQMSRWQFWRVDGVLDVRSGSGGSANPTRTGGGLRFDLPIFNRNQGGILRADWELNAARHNRDAIRDQIVLDVRTAVRQLRSSNENLQILQQQVLPHLEQSLEISQKGFADGGTNYLLVLQATSQYLDARSQILNQEAAVLRALAQLDRAVGYNLESGIIEVARLQDAIDATSEPVESVARLAAETSIQ